MTQLTYAGIGARATPPAILEHMTVMAAWLARKGWYLHSGGAAGADTAFATGAPQEPADTVPALARLPGPRGAGLPHALAEQMDRCLAIAATLHPAWHRCSPAARKLHARNAAILGAGTREPVHAVVAWSVGGAVTGGTGMSIRIAQAHDIPVLNLGVLHPRAVCRRLEEIRGEPPRPAPTPPASP